MSDTPLALIALDLDGTAVRYEPRLEIDPAVREALSEARAAGVGWMMNSDRRTHTMIEIAEQLPLAERPVAICSAQRDVHLHADARYEPLAAVNDAHAEIHGTLWREIRPFFPAWRREIADSFVFVAEMIDDDALAFCVPDGQAGDLRAVVREMVAPWPDAAVSGNNEWVFVLHASFSKARVLAAAADALGVAPASILAIGDGYNDLSMLDGTVTPRVGCPGDSCPEVLDAVRAAGGRVARESGPAGTAAIIRDAVRRRSS